MKKSIFTQISVWVLLFVLVFSFAGCGFKCEHEFKNGNCTKCNMTEANYKPVCNHTFQAGKCTKCNITEQGYTQQTCQHVYLDGKCVDCNITQPGYVPPQSGGVILDNQDPASKINPTIGKTDTYTDTSFTDTSVRNASGANGAVTSGSPWASKVGLEILQAGGNAFDAAAAIAIALGVTETGSSGIGGGGLMVAYNKNTGKSVYYNFREFAGVNARTGMTVSRPSVRTSAGRGVAVPTEVAGVARIVEDLGTMSLKDVMTPAINLARYGFVLDSRCASNIAGGETYINWTQDAKEIFTYEGNGIDILIKGDTLVQTDLANVLEYIAENGAAAFYTGELAQHIVNEIQATGGHVTMEDMLYAYQNYPKVSDPLAGTYAAETGKNYDILTVKHPSSGGKMLIEMFNMLECYNGNITDLGENSAEYINLISTVNRLAEGDRNKYMGDYNVNPATGEPFATDYTVGLTSKAYAAERFQKYVPGQKYTSSSSGVYYGDPSKYNDVTTPVSNIDALVYEGNDTTSFAVADSFGNIVAWTQTLQATFGSGVIPKDTGFILNNQMTDFSTSSSGVNIILPYKQPASSMTPTILLQNGQPYAAFGSPGGKEIVSGVYSVALWLMVWEKDMQSAINAGRIYCPVGSTIQIEKRWCASGSALEQALKDMGYTVTIESAHSTSIQGIRVMPDGSFDAGADTRRGAKALAY